MHVSGKSDEGVVSLKRTNKGVQPETLGQSPAESVEKRPSAKGNPIQATVTGTQRSEATSSGLARVREAAKRDKELRFTNLLHHISVEQLHAAYLTLNRGAATGVDDMTWGEYGEGLEERLAKLHDQLHGGRYRAKPSKRTWIPKSDGRQRPIGIAALEDKIVQQALVGILQLIYEEDFLGFSYGARPGRNQHNALDAIYVAIKQRKVNWVLDADIRGFFDNLDHGWLMKFVEHRVADRRVLRLIHKFLRAGVSEDGKWSKTVVGTPQGAVISPLLANIYLHYVLDLWVNWWRNHHARGEVYIVRYCDDFVMGVQYPSDAKRFHDELRKRLGKFGLELHDDKTRLIEFGRFAVQNRKNRGEGKPETFDFLGFTHICSERRKDGKFQLLRKTIGKRLREKIKKVRQTLQRHRHKPIPELGRWLRSVVQGHFNYYAVPGNREACDAFRTQIGFAWLRALRSRSQKGKSLTWERMQRKMMRRWIPTARVLHPYPDQRFCV
ncbi:group II intron reverse transcriptase/maturase [Desulfuromonas versatilis]|uniref:Group II intron reverse transcriptase/maturase n=1 Tax=Desulfuromonas versatilis TaxID=2802975 RepID=A0ABM8HSW8_9BACT|nr:group II intron reverse transcriptase/maturase [Desulfuromonas versatilis]